MNARIDLVDDLADKFVYVCADGEIDFDSSLQMLERALDLAAEKRVSKIVLDGLLLSGELTDLEGIDQAAKETGCQRQRETQATIAVVGHPPTCKGLLVMAAQSTGQDVRIFSSNRQAAEWLMSL